MIPESVADFVGAPLAGARQQDTRKGYPYKDPVTRIV